jgi:hypothetical protein
MNNSGLYADYTVNPSLIKPDLKTESEVFCTSMALKHPVKMN